MKTSEGCGWNDTGPSHFTNDRHAVSPVVEVRLGFMKRVLPGVHCKILVNVLCTTVLLLIFGRPLCRLWGSVCSVQIQAFWFFYLLTYTYNLMESTFTLFIFSHIKWWKENYFFFRPFVFCSWKYYDRTCDSGTLHQREVNAGGSTFPLRNVKKWTFHEKVGSTLE